MTADTIEIAPETALCPNCGKPFEKGGRGLGKIFCLRKCYREFDRRKKSEGGPMAPLVKAWIATRHAPAGTREAEICAYARRELTQIAGLLNDEDAENNRPSAILYVEALMRTQTLFVDRRRRK